MGQYRITGVRQDGSKETWQVEATGTWAAHEGAKVKRPELRILSTVEAYE